MQRHVDKLGANLEIESMAIWVPMYRLLRAAGLHAGGQADATDEMRSAVDATAGRIVIDEAYGL